MSKKARKLYQAVRRPLTAFLTLCLVLEMMPAQGLAFALEATAPEALEQVEPAASTPEVVADEAAAQEAQPTEQAEPVQEAAPAETPAPVAVTAVTEATTEVVEKVTEPVAQPAAPAEQAQPAAPAEPAYPAFYGEVWTESTLVSVSADEGVLPEGARLDLQWGIDPEPYKAAVDAATADDLSSAHVLRVVFYDANGAEIAPRGEVTVKVQGAEIDEADLHLYTMAADGSAAELAAWAVNYADSYTQEFRLTADEASRAFVIATTTAPVVDDEPAAEEVVPEEEVAPEEEVTPEENPAEEVVPAEEVTPEEQPAEETVPEEEVTPEEQPAEEVVPEEEAPAEPAYLTEPISAYAEDGMLVRIEPGEGSLPAGAYVEAHVVYATDAIVEAVEAQLEDGKTVQGAAAYDVTIYDAEGNEIEPTGAVSVKFFGADVTGSDISVYHVEGEAEAPVSVDEVETDFAGSAVQSFTTDGFSVYVVVNKGEDARLTVNFVNGETGKTIATMLVKQRDIIDGELSTSALYDPGVGDLEDGTYFRGWTQTEEYDLNTTALTIDEVRSEVKEKLISGSGVTEGDELTYYAIIVNGFAVSYKNETGVVMGAETIFTMGDSADYTVSMPYAPGEDQDFRGWYANPTSSVLVNGSEPATDQAIPNDTSVTLKGDVIFNVVAPKGAWLVFRENGKGASYTAPVFYDTNAIPERPANPQREGYNFVNWYEAVTDESGTPQQDESGNIVLKDVPFDFSQPMTKRTVVYAKWEAKSEASYTVIIWKQNVTATGYDFYKSVVLDGATNQAASINGDLIKSGEGDEAYAVIDGTSYRASSNTDFTGFHLNTEDFDKEVQTKVVPEGTTIVNVRYDRNTVTLNFYTWGSSGGRTPVSGSSGDSGYYYTSETGNNQYYVYYNADDGLWYTNRDSYWDWGWHYTYSGTSYSTVYAENASNTWNLYKSISGLYGATFSEVGVTWPTERDWYEGHDDRGNVYAPRRTFMDAFLPPNGGSEENFYSASTDTQSGKKIEFYKQKADKSGYELANTVGTSSNGRFTITDKYDGFHAASYNNGQDHQLNGKDAQGNYATDVRWSGTLKIYFDRDSYPILFMDGAYFRGINKLEQEPRGQLDEAQDINYGADITAYNKDGDEYVEPTFAGYVFEGWYLDDSCQQPCDFTTMPKGGLTVYAKWQQVEYRVFLHPQTDDESFDMGDQSTSFRIANGDSITRVNATRDDYELVGWYMDSNYKTPFNFEAFVLNDSTVTDEYDKTRPTELDKYGNPKDGDTTNKDAAENRFWITRSLDLYARWRSKLEGADGINVEYVYTVDGEEKIEKDELLYKDLATSYAFAAPSESPEGQHFAYWMVQSYNGTDYVDSEKVLPGQPFSVKKADAKRVITEGTEDEIITATYTVRVVGVFEDDEAETPTYINWYMNLTDGTTKVREDKDIAYNDSVSTPEAPTATGYTFLGWAKLPEETTTAPVQLTEDDVWLAWDGQSYTATVGDETVDASKVAADEILVNGNHDGLYAVWQVNSYTIKFDKNAEGANGTMADMTNVKYDEDVTLTPNAFTREGYTFVGWNTVAGGTGDSYVDRATVKNLTAVNNGVVTLYAQWVKNAIVDPASSETGVFATKTATGDIPDETTFNFTMSGPGLAEAAAGTATVTKAGQAVNVTGFPTLKFDHAGTYTYTIKETAGGDAHWTYDSGSKTVTVTVANNNGVLVPSVSETVNFDNAYKADPIVITNGEDATGKPLFVKTVSGTGFAKTKFEFDVTSGEGAPAAANSATIEFESSGTKTVDIGSFKFEKSGVYTYTVKEKTEPTKGWTNDNDAKTVTVTVANENGVLVASFDTAKIENSYKAKPVNYDPSDSSEGGKPLAKKTITGNTGFEEVEFNFMIAASEENPEGATAIGTTGSITVSDGRTGSTVIGGISGVTYSAAGEYKYNVTETGTDELDDGWEASTPSDTATVTIRDDGHGQLYVDSVDAAEIVNTFTKRPEITVTKKADKPAYEYGETVRYTIEVENTGNVKVSALALNEKLDGATIESALSPDTLVPGEKATAKVTYVVSASDAKAGTLSNVVEVTGTDPENETVQKESGVNVVTKQVPITITADDATKVYDGEALTKNSYKMTDGTLVSGDKIDSVTVTGSQTLVGTSPNVPSNAKIVNAELKDVTDGYAITYKTGTLTITDGTPDEPVDPSLVVTKSHEKGNYGLGDVVTFTIKATNIYKSAQTITLEEQEGVTLEKSVFENVAGGESINTTATYTITEDDILAESFTNTVKAMLGNITKTATDTVNADEIEDPNGHVTVTKVTTSETPEGGYKLGDEVTYTVTVKNDGNLTITDVTVTDERTGMSEKIASLAPGEEKSFETSTTVTEADILSGHIVNDATAKGTSPDPDEPDVPVDPGHTDDEPEAKNGHLTVTKETTSTKPEGGYKLGDTVSYKITVTNDGNLTITDVTVTDERTGMSEKIASLAPGEEKSFETSTTVTEADILSGHIVNEATAKGTSPDPDVPDVPVTPGKTDDEPEAKNGHLTVTKETTTKPANGSTYALGEKIEYKVTVTNDGNLTITDVKVDDEMTNQHWLVKSLAPGKSETFTASHIVTEADILAGQVVNVATAKGTSPDPEVPEPPVTPGIKVDPTDKPAPKIVSAKTSTGTMTGLDANGKPAYALGDELTYSVSVTNEGNLTAKGIEVVDAKLGYTADKPFVYEGEVKPGETVTVLTATYVVTEADVAAGSVLNEATVTATTDGGDPEPAPSKDEQPVEKIFTITYVPNGGNFNGSTENVVSHHKYGEVITIIGAPTRDGYTFTYWKGSEYQPGDKYTVTEDHTFVAQWEPKPEPAKPEPKKRVVRTGDDSLEPLYVTMAASGSALLALGALTLRRRRREDEDDVA